MMKNKQTVARLLKITKGGHWIQQFPFSDYIHLKLMFREKRIVRQQDDLPF